MDCETVEAHNRAKTTISNQIDRETRSIKDLFYSTEFTISLRKTASNPERARHRHFARCCMAISSCLLMEIAISDTYILKFTAVNPVTPNIAVQPHQALQAHNRYRALHHSPFLNWSEGLATEAQAIAQSLATQDLHSGRKDSAMDLGQNLAKLAGMNI